MKTVFKVLCVALLVAAVSFQGVCFSEEYKLSDDPRLVEPKESFAKALYYVEKGDLEFRRRPGLAQKKYEHAEDYFLKAAFMYKEIGQRSGIDVKHEIATCERMQRATHVKVNKARRQRKRTGSAF